MSIRPLIIVSRYRQAKAFLETMIRYLCVLQYYNDRDIQIERGIDQG